MNTNKLLKSKKAFKTLKNFQMDFTFKMKIMYSFHQPETN